MIFSSNFITDNMGHTNISGSLMQNGNYCVQLILKANLPSLTKNKVTSNFPITPPLEIDCHLMNFQFKFNDKSSQHGILLKIVVFLCFLL